MSRVRASSLGLMACTALSMSLAVASARGGQPELASVTPGYALSFPADLGSHPQYGIEWWYVTGWLTTGQHETLGFQITFFRVRNRLADANPSALAAKQLLIAHCALSDPARGRLWSDQRSRRAGLGLAEAETGQTAVWLDDWRLERHDSRYSAQIQADQFALQLQLETTQPPMLNGDAGFSQKGPTALEASYYYSEPHLRVSGSIARGARRDPVSGDAWLDHEWSSQYLDPAASGWEWMGLNLDDGGALMAFRIRKRDGGTLWSAATLRSADGRQRSLGTEQIQFIAGRRWRSPRTAVIYPISWRVDIAGQSWQIEPLMADQENDSRLSSGTLYWEGAVSALRDGHPSGHGYLELTGYDQPLRLP